MREGLQYFAGLMEEALPKDYGESFLSLLKQLRKEVDELEEALINNDRSTVQEKSVDVANCALLIFDNT